MIDNRPKKRVHCHPCFRCDRSQDDDAIFRVTRKERRGSMNNQNRWMIVATLFLGEAISFLDRSALSIVAPLMVRDLHLDSAGLGIVFSVFFMGYAICCFIGGMAADRFGPK